MNDLVSVIVPVYNIEGYLPHCLDSISHQTYKSLEILLIDDGSTDRSGEICDEYARKDSRCRVIHQPNMGLWAARNTGQKASKGSFLFFPDGDDYFHYDLIRQMREAISGEINYDVAIVGSRVTSDYDENVSAPVAGEWAEYSQEGLIKALLSSNDFPHPQIWNKLFRKTSLGDIQSRPFERAQDLDFVLRFLLKNERAIGTRKTMYYWVKHEGQLSRVQNAWVLYCKNDTEISRSILTSLPGDNQYRGLLLDFMYGQMATWRRITLDTADQEEACEACNKVYSATVKEYRRNSVTPIMVKLAKIICIRRPQVWVFIVRFLNRWQKDPLFMKMFKSVAR